PSTCPRRGSLSCVHTLGSTDTGRVLAFAGVRFAVEERAFVGFAAAPFLDAPFAATALSSVREDRGLFFEAGSLFAAVRVGRARVVSAALPFTTCAGRAVFAARSEVAFVEAVALRGLVATGSARRWN